ncbi:MAG: sigma-70 family RNA polymerase sigma factor [Halieaceae bacterium]|nr:sigma-70 family RNA polymerase sigma factor [Halieaceae bacterium]
MTLKETPRELAATLSGRRRELVRYLRSRLPSEDDAGDLAQEAYLRLLRLKDDHLILNPEAYLFRIASNLVHEYWLRAKSDAAETGYELDELTGNMQTPEILAGQRQVLDELERAIALLPQVQQSVILLHRRDGKTYEEIAGDLQISRDMVKKHLGKALARCRAYLALRKYEY